MDRKKKRKKCAPQKTKRLNITPASMIGIAIGLVLVGTGVYQAVAHREYGGYYVVALGSVFVIAVCWGSVRKR